MYENKYHQRLRKPDHSKAAVRHCNVVKTIGFPIESLDIRPENQHHFDNHFFQMWLKIRDTVQSPSSPQWFDVSAKSISSRIHVNR